jgi:hypothetical protein
MKRKMNGRLLNAMGDRRRIIRMGSGFNPLYEGDTRPDDLARPRRQRLRRRVILSARPIQRRLPMPEPARSPVDPRSVRALRPGHGANCSSIGSVVDTLFVTALLGGAIFAAVVAALGHERIEVVGPGGTGENKAPPERDVESDAPKVDST